MIRCTGTRRQVTPIPGQFTQPNSIVFQPLQSHKTASNIGNLHRFSERWAESLSLKFNGRARPRAKNQERSRCRSMNPVNHESISKWLRCRKTHVSRFHGHVVKSWGPLSFLPSRVPQACFTRIRPNHPRINPPYKWLFLHEKYQYIPVFASEVIENA